jgi:phage/plasmid-like protein (TIGR03299 family)
MSHNLDITAGQAAFVSARQDAWHQLGQVLPDTFTAEEAMTHGLLGGWNLRKVPLLADLGATVEVNGVPTRMTIPVSDRFAVIRDNPVVAGQVDVLGDVGKAYQIIQNEDLANLINTVVDQSGAHFETAGALDGGRKVWLSLALPGHIKVGGVDRVDNYINIMTSHDGSTATSIMVTPVRVVCQNTMNLAFQQATNMFKVRHTVGAHKILIQQAREALDFTFNYLEGFQQEAEQLINTTMTQTTFDQLIAREFGVSQDAPAPTVTRTQNKLDQMSYLFNDAATHAEVRGTAWAGLNALTEWYDHFSPVRGVATAADEVTVRSRKAILDPGFKNQALNLMLSAV